MGKSGTGIVKPIDAVSGMGGMLTNDRRGVGAGSTSAPVVMPGDTYKTAVRKVVRRRATHAPDGLAARGACGLVVGHVYHAPCVVMVRAPAQALRCCHPVKCRYPATSPPLPPPSRQARARFNEMGEEEGVGEDWLKKYAQTGAGGLPAAPDPGKG